jgi:hypothetical protein
MNLCYSQLMSTTILGFFNGVIYNDSTVRIAAITDDTSNTFLFGEHSKGHLHILDPSYAVSDNSSRQIQMPARTGASNSTHGEPTTASQPCRSR